MGKHQFLLGVSCQTQIGAIVTAALINADQKEFSGALAVVNIVRPLPEWIRTMCFDTTTDLIKIDNTSSARLEGIRRWNVAGAPGSGSFGVDGCEPVFEGLFYRPLHGVQIYLTVALNVNIFI